MKLFVVRLCLLILFSPSIAHSEGVGESVARKQTAKFDSITLAYSAATSDAQKIELRSELSGLYKTTSSADLKSEIHEFMQANPYPASGLTKSSSVAATKTKASRAN